jgi:hypothetical protein
MKKNEAMGYLAYALMLIVAVLVGFLVIRPDVSQYSNVLPINGIGLTVIALIIGIILTALFLELGHLLGAKAGRYTVTKWLVLGIGMKTNADGKRVFGVGNFDGLTGETAIVPKDKKKSNPRFMVWFGFLFILLEVVIMVVLMVLSTVWASKDGQESLIWLKIASETILAVAGMILVYDIFPAQIDSKNDGYLLTVLNNSTNVEAYNALLLAEDRAKRGLPPEETPVYEHVTDFTAKVNDVTFYANLDKEDYEGAIKIVDLTIASKKTVSAAVYKQAVSNKVALTIMTLPHDEAEKYFNNLKLEDKKYLASLGSVAAIRAYVLANGLIENSLSEVRIGLDKASSALKKVQKEHQQTEKNLLRKNVYSVLEAHPDWDLSEYGFKPAKEEAEAKAEEADPKPEDKGETK